MRVRKRRTFSLRSRTATARSRRRSTKPRNASSLLDFARVMERMSKLGVGLVSVTQNFSTTDAIERLTLNVLMSFAEYERATRSRQTGQVDGRAIADRLPERKRFVDQIAMMAARERTLSDEIEAAAGRAAHAREALINRLDQAVQWLRESQRQLLILETLDDARSEAEWVRRILSGFDRMWQAGTRDTQAHA